MSVWTMTILPWSDYYGNKRWTHRGQVDYILSWGQSKAALRKTKHYEEVRGVKHNLLLPTKITVRETQYPVLAAAQCTHKHTYSIYLELYSRYE